MTPVKSGILLRVMFTVLIAIPALFFSFLIVAAEVEGVSATANETCKDWWDRNKIRHESDQEPPPQCEWTAQNGDKIGGRCIDERCEATSINGVNIRSPREGPGPAAPPRPDPVESGASPPQLPPPVVFTEIDPTRPPQPVQITFQPGSALEQLLGPRVINLETGTFMTAEDYSRLINTDFTSLQLNDTGTLRQSGVPGITLSTGGQAGLFTTGQSTFGLIDVNAGSTFDTMFERAIDYAKNELRTLYGDIREITFQPAPPPTSCGSEVCVDAQIPGNPRFRTLTAEEIALREQARGIQELIDTQRDRLGDARLLPGSREYVRREMEAALAVQRELDRKQQRGESVSFEDVRRAVVATDRFIVAANTLLENDILSDAERAELGREIAAVQASRNGVDGILRSSWVTLAAMGGEEGVRNRIGVLTDQGNTAADNIVNITGRIMDGPSSVGTLTYGIGLLEAELADVRGQIADKETRVYAAFYASPPPPVASALLTPSAQWELQIAGEAALVWGPDGMGSSRSVVLSSSGLGGDTSFQNIYYQDPAEITPPPPSGPLPQPDRILELRLELDDIATAYERLDGRLISLADQQTAALARGDRDGAVDIARQTAETIGDRLAISEREQVVRDQIARMDGTIGGGNWGDYPPPVEPDGAGVRVAGVLQVGGDGTAVLPADPRGPDPLLPAGVVLPRDLVEYVTHMFCGETGCQDPPPSLEDGRRAPDAPPPTADGARDRSFRTPDADQPPPPPRQDPAPDTDRTVRRQPGGTDRTVTQPPPPNRTTNTGLGAGLGFGAGAQGGALGGIGQILQGLAQLMGAGQPQQQQPPPQQPPMVLQPPPTTSPPPGTPNPLRPAIGVTTPTIKPGEQAKIIWNASRATSCTLTQGTNTLHTGIATDSFTTPTLQTTTSYTLSCTGDQGTATTNVTVYVGEQPPASVPKQTSQPAPTITASAGTGGATSGTGGTQSSGQSAFCDPAWPINAFIDCLSRLPGGNPYNVYERSGRQPTSRPTAACYNRLV